MSGSIILLLCLAAVVVYGIIIYNQLVTLKNRFLNAFSQIDVQLQRRYELIPNLVEIASKYISHEKETLTAVISARNNASERCKDAAAEPQDASLVGALAKAEQSLTNAMGKLNVVMEDYPELKADETLRDLHEELSTTENRVAFSRQAYSDAVMVYNTEREKFPANIVAAVVSMKEADLFEADSEEIRKPVKVSFA